MVSSAAFVLSFVSSLPWSCHLLLVQVWWCLAHQHTQYLNGKMLKVSLEGWWQVGVFWVHMFLGQHKLGHWEVPSPMMYLGSVGPSHASMCIFPILVLPDMQIYIMCPVAARGLQKSLQWDDTWILYLCMFIGVGRMSDLPNVLLPLLVFFELSYRSPGSVQKCHLFLWALIVSITCLL